MVYIGQRERSHQENQSLPAELSKNANQQVRTWYLLLHYTLNGTFIESTLLQTSSFPIAGKQGLFGGPFLPFKTSYVGLALVDLSMCV